MRIKLIDIDLDAVDADGIAQSQTPTEAGNLTLNGALGTTLDYARVLVLTTAADETTKTFTITGTGSSGEAIVEELTGVNNTTALTTNYFKTITSIAVSAATAGAITFGTSAATRAAQSQAVPLEYLNEVPATYHVTVVGTINFTVLESFDDLLKNGVGSDTGTNFHALTALEAKTATTTAVGTRGSTAVKIRVNSYSSGAEVQLTIVPASC